MLAKILLHRSVQVAVIAGLVLAAAMISWEPTPGLLWVFWAVFTVAAITKATIDARKSSSGP